MMMILGMFPFMLATTPYQSLNQSNNWRYAKNERVGKSPRYQYIGAGDASITLSGVLCPEVSGGSLSLVTLETMAYAGLPWPLIECTGRILGMYAIESITQTRTEFFSDGAARRIEFSLKLTRVSEDIREKLAELNVRGLIQSAENLITK
ncbi:phage tail protein [Hafnia alvei]|uniref:phage tail protein n=1 Tax=Hafnia alvei TaxID=569 RepID=UPI000B694D57|nr:phage tail protein [Hafnia alvei]MBI0277267.1 phage tail protein [Hafnia alvei]PNK97555.1 oxidoreductase [Hafnia alvei]PNL03589.1 oxidoreductase [Hafnia alvei]